jgi:hypothetical protein
VNRGLTSLLLVLVIQCGLVAAVYWPGSNRGYVPPKPMVPFDHERIDVIYVGDEFDNETVLSKFGQRWSLPELENLPADSAMVDRLLEAITAGDGSWPIAHSVAARQRFRVASYHYRRRVSLLEGETILGTFLLGTSPGFRKIYARNEEQDAIYGILLAAHDAPGNSGAWLDRKLLQTRAPLRITADTYSLQREGTGWLSGIGGVPDERELEALLSTLRDLQIDGLASGDAQRDLAAAESDMVLVVESLAGKVTLELFHHDGEHYIHSNEYPLFFTLSAYDYDRLATIDFSLISGDKRQQTPIYADPFSP